VLAIDLVGELAAMMRLREEQKESARIGTTGVAGMGFGLWRIFPVVVSQRSHRLTLQP
jgi:hypothetical protein